MSVRASQGPGSLSIISVVLTGGRLYRINFSRYVAIALRGTLWIFLPVLLLTVSLLWILKQGIGLGDFSGLTALFIPAWLLLLLWCKAQSLGWLAAISRLGYQSLVSSALEERALESSFSEDRETPDERCLRFTRSRRFSLLGSVIIRWLIAGTVVVAGVIALLLSVGMTFAGMGMVPGAEPSLSLFFLGGGSGLVSVAVFAGLYVWLMMRLLVAEQALAIEKESGAIASVGRSWQLTKRNVLRATCVAVLAFFVSLPVLFLTWLAAQSLSFIALEQAGVQINRAEISSVDFLPLVIAYLIMMLVSMVGDIITQPFFRAVFTTLYLDVRNRKERLASM